MSKNASDYFPEHFRDFAMMPKFGENIETLTTLAEPENWDYNNTPANFPHPILRNYLTYTYQRVAEEGKIEITPDAEYCCWNTGLISATQEPIFALFSRERLNKS